MAAAEEELDFQTMTKAELRTWVEVNPGRVKNPDKNEVTPFVLCCLAYNIAATDAVVAGRVRRGCERAGY